MFQSSSTASGSWRLQASSAFSPSSASMIWKSSPSRIRRATLRMTLESSTTRHVLISAPRYSSRPGTSSFQLFLRGRSPASCRLRFGGNFEPAIDVEHNHELAVEAMDATGELGHARVEIDRVFLAA